MDALLTPQAAAQPFGPPPLPSRRAAFPSHEAALVAAHEAIEYLIDGTGHSGPRGCARLDHRRSR